ncbi:acyltransferase domain-containing protein [Kitasatospora sp. NPDC057904]|uniref:acyltransferase domain-containing protein n=1 Tax=Kitasatospora sp. NPDC057904 TaxID=3346275 RepID=UPI0036DE1B3C
MSDLAEPRIIAWAGADERAEETARTELADRLAAAAPDRPDAPDGPDGPDGPGRIDGIADEAARRLADIPPAHRAVRGALVASSVREAAELLRTDRALRRDTRRQPPRPVGLLFPGHGSQHPRMGAGLYGHDAAFSAAMDDFFAAVGPTGPMLREAWLAEDPERRIDEGELGQPLLYAVGHALARMLAGWGLRPAAVLGHSVGELVAATVAGVLRPRDGARLMAARSHTYAPVVPGGLVTVAASARELAPFAVGDVSVAVVNGPRQTALGAPAAALAALEHDLRLAGFVARRTRIRQPFHTPHAVPAAELFEPAFAAVALRPPELPVYSSATAAPVRPHEALRPRFWARQMSDPVLFGPALDRLLADHRLLLVEAGPGQALTALALRHPAVTAGRSAAVGLLPARPGGDGSGNGRADREAALRAAARIWVEGHQLDRTALN